MKPMTWGTFVASAVVGAALVLPLKAGAFQRRIDATACYPSNLSGSAQACPGDWDIWNNGPGNLYMMCPLPDDDSLLPQNINYLNVHGLINSNGGTVTARPCLHFYNQFGGTCASGMTASAPNSPFAIALGRQVLFYHPSIFNQFKYVAVTLPPQTGLTGMFIADQ